MKESKNHYNNKESMLMRCEKKNLNLFLFFNNFGNQLLQNKRNLKRVIVMLLSCFHISCSPFLFEKPYIKIKESKFKN